MLRQPGSIQPLYIVIGAQVNLEPAWTLIGVGGNPECNLARLCTQPIVTIDHADGLGGWIAHHAMSQLPACFHRPPEGECTFAHAIGLSVSIRRNNCQLQIVGDLIGGCNTFWPLQAGPVG